MSCYILIEQFIANTYKSLILNGNFNLDLNLKKTFETEICKNIEFLGSNHYCWPKFNLIHKLFYKKHKRIRRNFCFLILKFHCKDGDVGKTNIRGMIKKI